MTVSAKRETKVELKSTFDPKGVQDARRSLRDEQRAQARAAKQAERDAKKMRKELLGGGRTVLGGVGEGLGMAFGFQALGGIEGMATGVMNFNEQLMRFGLAARKTPEEADAIGAAARRVAAETGLASETVLAGARAYIDLAGAENYSEEMMRTLARSAQASGAAIGDMATVAYSLQNALHIKPGEMEDVIGGLINQSKDGTIHFQNMAQEIIALAPKFARFGVLGRQGASELGAMLQVAGSGFKDAAEASTGIQGLFRGLQLHEDKFRNAGVATMKMGRDGAKHLRPLEEIVNDISKSSLMKDPSKLLKAIGRGEGDAFLRLWIEQIAKYKELFESAQAHGVVQKDLATVTESTAGRTAIAMERIKNAIAEAFTPDRIEKFLGMFEGLADKASTFADVLGKIGDAFGALYDVGKAVRGSLTPGDSRLAAITQEDINLEKARMAKITKEDIDRESAGHGVSREQAIKNLTAGVSTPQAIQNIQAEHGRYLAAKQAIVDAMHDDKTTPESNKRAVAAFYAQNDESGEGARRAGAEYISAAHLSPETIKTLAKQVREEAIDAAIAEGRAKTDAPVEQADLMAQFQRAMEAAAPAFGRSVAEAVAAQPPHVKVGSEPLVKGAKNAHVLHSRPGGRP